MTFYGCLRSPVHESNKITMKVKYGGKRHFDQHASNKIYTAYITNFRNSQQDTTVFYYLNLWTFADMAKSPQCFPRGSPVYTWYALEDYILQILHLCKMDSRRITSRIWCSCRNTTANNIFWLPHSLELPRTCLVRRFETKKNIIEV